MINALFHTYSTTLSMTEVDAKSILEEEYKAHKKILEATKELDNRSKVRVLRYLLSIHE